MQKINRGQTMWPLRQRAAREIKEERGALRGRRPAEPPSDLWRIQTGTKKPAVESRQRAEQNRESGSGMTTHWPPCLLSFSWSGPKETPLHSRTDPPACSACLSCSGGETGRKVTGNIKINHSAAWLTVMFQWLLVNEVFSLLRMFGLNFGFRSFFFTHFQFQVCLEMLLKTRPASNSVWLKSVSLQQVSNLHLEDTVLSEACCSVYLCCAVHNDGW